MIQVLNTAGSSQANGPVGVSGVYASLAEFTVAQHAR
jgi:hypothetical protein